MWFGAAVKEAPLRVKHLSVSVLLFFAILFLPEPQGSEDVLKVVAATAHRRM